MSRLVYDDERIAAFVSVRSGQAISPPFRLIGVELDGLIVAGAVINCWTGPDCELSIASDRGRITRPFLKALGKYIGDDLGCCRVTMTTDQPLIISMAKRLGGEIEGYKRNNFGPGRDGVLIGILKENWKFR